MNTPAREGSIFNPVDAPQYVQVCPKESPAEEQVYPGNGSHQVCTNKLPHHSFPEKLHFVLTELEREGKAHIAGFLPHGRAFKVFKHREFDEVLRSWFRQTKFASFQRQLNIYGFTRITAGQDMNACYHELFLRGSPELSKRIRRIPVKGQGPRRASCDTVVPNFYAMPYLPIVPVSTLGANHVRSSVVGNYHCSGIRVPHSSHRQIGPVHTNGKSLVQRKSLADEVLALSQCRRQSHYNESLVRVVSEARAGDSRTSTGSNNMTGGVPKSPDVTHSLSLTAKMLVMASLSRRQQEQRHELRLQLERRLLEEHHGGPDLPSVLRAALVSLRNSTL